MLQAELSAIDISNSISTQICMGIYSCEEIYHKCWTYRNKLMGIAEGGQIIEFGFKFNTWGPF